MNWVLIYILGGAIMTKEEFNKEYKHAEYRYAELKQYKKLYDNGQ